MSLFNFTAFSDLATADLYDILKLRTNVFVVEQNCPYPELDDKDKDGIHVYCKDENEMLAVARILPAGISYKEWSFGRIATHKKSRGTGLGKELMTACMNFMKLNHPAESVRISAQSHLEKFYGSFGFVSTGKNYLEDGIPHIEMLFEPKVSKFMAKNL
ncbi:MAG: GNAT family N-acetyltransferase [Crocinitomicaceae bacterium]